MQPTPPIQPEGIFDGLRASAIFLGAFVDIVFTMVAGWVLIAWLAPEALDASDQAELLERVAALNAMPEYVFGAVFVGTLGTLVGGYAGARRAGRLHVRHGGWIAVTSAALGALMLAFEPPGPQPAVPFPFWAEAIGLVLILPAGLAGGALARWRVGASA
jgi:hypothetical protein